ncbi:MAG: FAD-dependent monooxygenase [Xanthobacteraceae bacterium]|nr:FAD-dependent monooxygenase [Xanthobacteraceae bacterium]
MPNTVSPSFEADVPVLVVGAGPAGLTAALLLQRLGVPALTVSRYGWTANSPRAHYQNQRSIEILRELGLEHDVMSAGGLHDDLMQNVVWASSLSGTEFARLPTYMAARRDEYIGASPCRSANIAQHLLEPIMAQAAMARGARIRWGHELTGLSQDADGVVADLVDRSSGRAYKVRARYLIGADGARSRVAEAAGISHAGPAGWAAAVNVWFRADLSRYCAHRPGFLYWINRPGVDFWIGSGAFVNVQPWDEWVLSFMYDPSQGEPDLSETALASRIRDLAGDNELNVEILSANPWLMNAQVAERMAQGRVFIVGDAAHRHPPSGALGSNTSMQDAYNLVWKLKLVLDGTAGPALLDSYDGERRQVAGEIVDRSMQSARELGAIAGAIGFTPQQSEAEGWAAWRDVTEATAVGRGKREALRKAVALQQYHFCGHGVELGVRYAAGAFVPDHGAAAVDDGRDPQIHYHPTTSPGAHLPHAWLEQGGRICSTLDLAGNGRFALLAGHGHAAWRDAAEAVRAEFGLPLLVCPIGTGLAYADPVSAWAELRGVDDDGAILVRPDNVVAWRSRSRPDDPRAALRAALVRVLGRDI